MVGKSPYTKRQMDILERLVVERQTRKLRSITTSDGSFDYTSEGMKFLGSIRPEDCRIENAGITCQGIFINAD